MQSKLTLVGAGPGDSELITLKAIKALQGADVVLYDALANDSFLEYAPSHAVKINVGKRKGQHSFKQDEINKLIVDSALEHGHVVRLKGGDPFVFGRGYEELEYAKKFDIATEVIPGVSSSIGVAASVQIPITHRDIARSFWVVTGHTNDGSLPLDIDLAAQSSATVVILMGMSKLQEILGIFDKHGKSTTPIAIIQNGTMENQKSVFGRICDINSKVNESQVTNPAVIIIGEVVSLHPEYLEQYVAELTKQ
ncbi:uroporphyrin-III C-methyltransferase [Emticicia oligotrophica DSM 17448]|uniref:uroporphyrinogen-III C-methyltransferase n=1 Tax=Emticicia oligotrophica (strain DSM 17448 / CIP 109782 / MTCC 6937 / GPTSA100-15) TaxID=929562 RepID=A0ABM5N4R8_EMTOG|nr:uroporphyrinogen-III C-methyltransferase [Emticicia oligotrophica]AFK04367.1 uroporphyrin-III C-methyltransferase [Emticicia oligotrophica DSM 17448]